MSRSEESAEKLRRLFESQTQGGDSFTAALDELRAKRSADYKADMAPGPAAPAAPVEDAPADSWYRKLDNAFEGSLPFGAPLKRVDQPAPELELPKFIPSVEEYKAAHNIGNDPSTVDKVGEAFQTNPVLRAISIASTGNVLSKAEQALLEQMGYAKSPLIVEPNTRAEKALGTVSGLAEDYVAGKVLGAGKVIGAGAKGVGSVLNKVGGLVKGLPTIAKIPLGAAAIAGAADTGVGAFSPNNEIGDRSFLEQVGASLRVGTGSALTNAGYVAEWQGQDALGAKLDKAGKGIGAGYESDPVAFTWQALLNPEFYSINIAQTIPSILELIPVMYAGYKVAGWAGAKAALGPAAIQVLKSLGGAGLSRAVESSMEAGSTYEAMREKNATREEATAAANEAWKKNMWMAGGDAFQLFLAVNPIKGFNAASRLAKVGMTAGKIGFEIGSEGLEEDIQQIIQQQATGEDRSNVFHQLVHPTAAQKESFVIGAALGGGPALTGAITDRLPGTPETPGTPMPEPYEPAPLIGTNPVQQVRDIVNQRREAKITGPALGNIYSDLSMPEYKSPGSPVMTNTRPSEISTAKTFTSEEALLADLYKPIAKAPQATAAPTIEAPAALPTPAPVTAPQVTQEATAAETGGETVRRGRDEKYGVNVEMTKSSKGEYIITETEDTGGASSKDISGRLSGIWVGDRALNMEGEFVPGKQLIQAGTATADRAPFKPAHADRQGIVDLVAEIEYTRALGDMQKVESLEATLRDKVFAAPAAPEFTTLITGGKAPIAPTASPAETNAGAENTKSLEGTRPSATTEIEALTSKQRSASAIQKALEGRTDEEIKEVGTWAKAHKDYWIRNFVADEVLRSSQTADNKAPGTNQPETKTNAAEANVGAPEAKQEDPSAGGGVTEKPTQKTEVKEQEPKAEPKEAAKASEPASLEPAQKQAEKTESAAPVTEPPAQKTGTAADKETNEQAIPDDVIMLEEYPGPTKIPTRPYLMLEKGRPYLTAEIDGQKYISDSHQIIPARDEDIAWIEAQRAKIKDAKPIDDVTKGAKDIFARYRESNTVGLGAPVGQFQVGKAQLVKEDGLKADIAYFKYEDGRFAALNAKFYGYAVKNGWTLRFNKENPRDQVFAVDKEGDVKAIFMPIRINEDKRIVLPGQPIPTDQVELFEATAEPEKEEAKPEVKEQASKEEPAVVQEPEPAKPAPTEAVNTLTRRLTKLGIKEADAELIISMVEEAEAGAKKAGVNLALSIDLSEKIAGELTEAVLKQHGIKPGTPAYIAGKTTLESKGDLLSATINLLAHSDTPITQEVIHEFAEVWTTVWKQAKPQEYSEAVKFLTDKGLTQERAEEHLPEILADYAMLTGNQQKSVIQKLSAEFKSWLTSVFKRLDFFKKRIMPKLPEGVKAQAEAFAKGDWEKAFEGLGNVAFKEERYSVKEYAPPFYSQLERTLEERLPAMVHPAQITGTIKNIKADELKWSGINEWLAQQKGKVSKQDVLDFVRSNDLQIEEVTKSDRRKWIDARMSELDHIINLSDASAEEIEKADAEYAALDNEYVENYATNSISSDIKFEAYTLPGGENYRELLFTLPEGSMSLDAYSLETQGKPLSALSVADQETVKDMYSRASGTQKTQKPTYRSGHWEESNVLAHVRFNDRTDATGKKIILLEEIQSDWHQTGRQKGYKGDNEAKMKSVGISLRKSAGATVFIDSDGKILAPDPDMFTVPSRVPTEAEAAVIEEIKSGWRKGSEVPDAPFQKTWHEFVMKRMLRYAAENGYDAVAWTPGEQQAERYDLSKQVEAVVATKNPQGDQQLEKGDWHLEVEHLGGGRTDTLYVSNDKLADTVGKDLAEKIVSDGGGTYSGLDLKVGGEGMVGFYDRILPAFMNKYVKKWGAAVGESSVSTESWLAQDTATYEGPDMTVDDLKKLLTNTPGNQYISPFTGERLMFPWNRVAIEQPVRGIIKEMKTGKSFKEMMEEIGHGELAEVLGGKLITSQKNKLAVVHSVPVTPTMKQAVLFEGQPKYSVRADGLDAILETYKKWSGAKISDFGEKIGGAKKDNWADRNLTEEDLVGMTDREADKYVTKDAVWKKMDYAQMVEDGMEPHVAYLIKKIHDALPAKVSPTLDTEKNKVNRENYIEFVGQVRDAVAQVKTEADFKGLFDKIFVENGYYVRQAQGRGTWTEKNNRSIESKFIKDVQVGVWEISSAKRKVKSTGFPGKVEQWRKNIHIRHSSQGDWFITRDSRILADGFKTEEEAKAYLENELKDKLKKDKPKEPVLPQLAHIERTGKDYRKGKDATGQALLDTFGFRGGEFGNWNSQAERQASLNYAYDGLMDMAEALGISPKDVSLGGQLGVAFGARGSGGKNAAAAHYEPSKIVINLTKMKGAGSLAHEWFHAVDDYLGRLSETTTTLYSAGEGRGKSKLPEKVSKAFSSLKDTVLKADKTAEEIIASVEKGIARAVNNIDYYTAPYVKRLESKAQAIKYIDAIKAGEDIQKNIDDLSGLLKADTGRGISKEDREQLYNTAHYQIKLSQKTIEEAKSGKAEGKRDSDFYKNAKEIDSVTRESTYWARIEEMLARAFAAYAQGMIPEKSQYLVHSANNGAYGELNPYPAGKERTEINLAFAGLFKALVDEGVMGKVGKLEKVQAKLNEKIDEAIGDVNMPAGMSIKIVGKKQTAAVSEEHQIEDPEIRARFERAKGLPKESMLLKVKEFITVLRNKATREYEHLPRTAEFSPLRNDLLKLAKQKGVRGDETLRLLQGITINLDKKQFSVFRHHVILADLVQELKAGHALPFGFDEETLSREWGSVQEAAENDPEIQRALGERKDVWAGIIGKYVAAQEEIGHKVDKKFTRVDYYRHQVLEYAQARGLTGTGSKLKTPANRGFLKQREGSALDINTDYLQAEYEVMARMLYDTEVAGTIAGVNKNYNIIKQVRAAAKKANTENLEKIIQAEKDANGTSAVEEKLKTFDEEPKGRAAFIEETLGKKFKFWENSIPDGYVAWQPREGNTFFMADTIPAEVADQLYEQVVSEMGVSAGDLNKVMVVGSKRPSFILKEEVALTLDELVKDQQLNPLLKPLAELQKYWKIWQLVSPRRWFKYNARNLSGDAEAIFVGSPAAFLKIPQAIKELYPVFAGNKPMSKNMKIWFERGGMQTLLQAQELSDINQLKMFIDLEKSKGKLSEMPTRLWQGYWKAARLSTDFREAILRYASFLSYLEQMQNSETGRPKNFGASIREELMALDDVGDRAFKLSNELLGAYDQVGVFGNDLRRYLIPFWSWNEVNFRRTKQLIFNTSRDSGLAKAAAKKVAGTMVFRSPLMAYNFGKFAMKAAGMWVLLQLWNEWKWPEEEKSLPIKTRSRPHIIFGRDKDGKVVYFDRLGFVQDFLAWFGMDESPLVVRDWLNGKRTLKEIAAGMAKSPANKLIGGLGPLLKTPVELLYGKTMYPDVFKMRSIRDRWQYLADSVGLGNEYKALTGKPLQTYGTGSRTEGYWRSWEEALYYKADPLQSAYYDILDAKYRYLAKKGEPQSSGAFYTPKSNSLYNYKLALRYKDKEAAHEALSEYVRLGGTQKGLDQSLKTMNPAYGLNQAEATEFVAGLDAEDKVKVRRAQTYYETVLMGK